MQYEVKMQASQLNTTISDFLIQEACLLDRRHFDEWFSLWMPGEIEYWVPCNNDERDPTLSLAIILDNRKHLYERIKRLDHRNAHAFQPTPRTQRLVGNIAVTEEGDGVTVSSSFILGEILRGNHTIWFGRATHTLVMHDDVLRIRKKKVVLLNNDEPMSMLGFLP